MLVLGLGGLEGWSCAGGVCSVGLGSALLSFRGGGSVVWGLLRVGWLIGGFTTVSPVAGCAGVSGEEGLLGGSGWVRLLGYILQL